MTTLLRFPAYAPSYRRVRILRNLSTNAGSAMTMPECMHACNVRAGRQRKCEIILINAPCTHKQIGTCDSRTSLAGARVHTTALACSRLCRHVFCTAGRRPKFCKSADLPTSAQERLFDTYQGYFKGQSQPARTQATEGGGPEHAISS